MVWQILPWGSFVALFEGVIGMEKVYHKKMTSCKLKTLNLAWKFRNIFDKPVGPLLEWRSYSQFKLGINASKFNVREVPRNVSFVQFGGFCKLAYWNISNGGSLLPCCSPCLLLLSGKSSHPNEYKRGWTGNQQ